MARLRDTVDALNNDAHGVVRGVHAAQTQAHDGTPHAHDAHETPAANVQNANNNGLWTQKATHSSPLRVPVLRVTPEARHTHTNSAPQIPLPTRSSPASLFSGIGGNQGVATSA
jgi:hypothetical protein